MIQNMLKKSELFSKVESEYLDTLVNECTEVILEPREILFHQGDIGNGMYIITEGEIDIILEQKETSKVVATLSTGAFFGEFCMLVPQTRTATAKALKPSKLLYLDIKQFQEHIKNKNVNALQISHNIALTLIDRLKKANKILSSLPEEDSYGNKIREITMYKEKLLAEVLF